MGALAFWSCICQNVCQSYFWQLDHMLEIFAVSMIFPVLLKRILRFREVNSPRSPSKEAVGIKLPMGERKSINFG